MFDLKIIDVFIGILLIFTLYSLITTIVMEILVTMLGLRARNLSQAVARMLLDDSPPSVLNVLAGLLRPVKELFISACKFLGLTRYLPSRLKDDPNLPSSKFYNHALIKGLAQGRIHNKPSYIKASTFADVMLNLLATHAYEHLKDVDDQGINIIEAEEHDPETIEEGIDNFFKDNPDTHALMLTYLNKSQGDIDKFKVYLEQWYDNTMDRATGWFKRRTRNMLLALGLLIAATFNVDTIGIVKTLAKDKDARDKLVEIATDKQETLQGYMDKIEELRANQNSLNQDSLETMIRNDSAKAAQLEQDLEQYQALLDDALKDAEGVNDLLSIARPADFNAYPDKDSLVFFSFKGDNKELLKAKWKESYDTLSYYCVCLKKGVLCNNVAPVRQAKIDSSGFLKAAELPTCPRISYFFNTIFGYHFHWLGYLITALAISLGAPFWFDLLNKIVGLRNSVKELTGSDEDKSAASKKDALKAKA